MLSSWLRSNRHGTDIKSSDGMRKAKFVALSFVAAVIVYILLLLAQDLLMPNHLLVYLYGSTTIGAVMLFLGAYSSNKIKRNLLMILGAVFFLALYGAH